MSQQQTSDGNISRSAKRPLGSVQYDHSGRVVLVTGGCNGIGRAICDGFANSGATVVCADIESKLAAGLPPGVHFRKTDVAVEAECKSVVDWTVSEFGGLDVLVNNAAIQPASSYVRIEDVNRDDYDRMVAINLTGFAFMAKYGLKVMRQQQSGVLVNIASGQAHRTSRGVPVYGPIKAANVLQAMQWGVEYARDGIRVVSVSPGAINTPLVQAILEQQGGEKELANRHPLGRLGQPEEIAHAVLWLTSSAASFITATDLAVDGGLGGFGSFADPYPMQ
ncbi:MAG: SDR family NAD(P)-dependent oxidoreductase [Pirellula sp.]|jgi:NAD(P)-dependent dehydrogenase (short-subunit alcohol dehydrogenase family)